MYFLTRTCGILFFAAAAATGVMSFVDTAPDIAAANEALGTQPIASSVKFTIGSQVVVDVIFFALFLLIGWFLWSSEIQQTWAVVTTGLLVIGSIVIRVEPVMPIEVGRISPGLAFWGALVIDDFYPPPLKADTERRNVTTFPSDRYYYMVATEQNLPGTEQHPQRSVVLNFNNAKGEAGKFWAHGHQGAQVIGRLAGTRTILDYDHGRDTYAVPHMMVEEVAPAGARRQQ